MKKMKRLAALFLAVVMVMAMGMTAFATEANPTLPNGTKDEDGTYTLTLDKAKAAENHVYKVYQIYTGDVSVQNGNAVLSNIKYGSANLKIPTGKKVGDLLTSEEIEALKESIKNGKTGLEFAKEYGDAIKKAEQKPEPADTLTKEENVAHLVAGYYLVIDEWTNSTDPNATEQEKEISNFVISIVGATSFAPKVVTEPGLTKTALVDNKDVTVISDQKVGAIVDFTLTATMPADFQNYDAYKVTFHDTLSDGLDYKANSAKVYIKIGDTENEVTTEVPQVTFTERQMEYTINDVFEFATLTRDTAADAKIIIKYKAEINNTATVRLVDTNKATLEYTNGSSDDQKGITREKIVTVLFAELDITKIDGDVETRTLLPGAGFKLYRYDGTKENKKGEVVKEIKSTKETPISEFKFDRLEAGKYVLEESQTPSGYNKIEDKYFEVKFSGTPGDGSAEAKMINLSVKEINADGSEKEKGLVATANNETQIAALDIVNARGVQLPSTGGIGTTIFYVVGGILVLGAGVLLITKKRMSARD